MAQQTHPRRTLASSKPWSPNRSNSDTAVGRSFLVPSPFLKQPAYEYLSSYDIDANTQENTPPRPSFDRVVVKRAPN